MIKIKQRHSKYIQVGKLYRVSRDTGEFLFDIYYKNLESLMSGFIDIRVSTIQHAPLFNSKKNNLSSWFIYLNSTDKVYDLMKDMELDEASQLYLRMKIFD